MSTTRTLSLNGALAGKTFSGTFRRTGATETNGEKTLAAGSAGTLTARVDNDTGTATLSAGHGLVSTDVVDVFWAGATPGIRRGMVATVVGDAVTIDGGAGDNLPVLATPLVVDKQEVIDFDSDNATIILAAVSQQRRASVQFQTDVGAAILSLDLGKSGVDGEPFVWANNQNVATPFGAVISKIAVSNGSSGGTNTVVAGVLRS